MGRTLADDWYPGEIPDNVLIDEEAYLETTFSFVGYRSRADIGVRLARGAHTYKGTTFDVGPSGRVRLGEYALVHGARIICDSLVEIGDHAMLSWNVLLMDSYRTPRAPEARRALLREIGASSARGLPPDHSPRPVIVGPNTWIGFDSCVLPGVTVGRGSIVGARSVVVEDVPPYTVVAGNPSRVIRRLEA
jgi:carbonic anhydrase/acetyltransferase-like protein (isoleucine patch superfamily)